MKWEIEPYDPKKPNCVSAKIINLDDIKFETVKNRQYDFDCSEIFNFHDAVQEFTQEEWNIIKIITSNVNCDGKKMILSKQQLKKVYGKIDDPTTIDLGQHITLPVHLCERPLETADKYKQLNLDICHLIGLPIIWLKARPRYVYLITRLNYE